MLIGLKLDVVVEANLRTAPSTILSLRRVYSQMISTACTIDHVAMVSLFLPAQVDAEDRSDHDGHGARRARTSTLLLA